MSVVAVFTLFGPGPAIAPVIFAANTLAIAAGTSVSVWAVVGVLGVAGRYGYVTDTDRLEWACSRVTLFGLVVGAGHLLLAQLPYQVASVVLTTVGLPGGGSIPFALVIAVVGGWVLQTWVVAQMVRYLTLLPVSDDTRAPLVAFRAVLLDSGYKTGALTIYGLITLLLPDLLVGPAALAFTLCLTLSGPAVIWLFNDLVEVESTHLEEFTAIGGSLGVTDVDLAVIDTHGADVREVLSKGILPGYRIVAVTEPVVSDLPDDERRYLFTGGLVDHATKMPQVVTLANGTMVGVFLGTLALEGIALWIPLGALVGYYLVLYLPITTYVRYRADSRIAEHLGEGTTIEVLEAVGARNGESLDRQSGLSRFLNPPTVGDRLERLRQRRV